MKTLTVKEFLQNNIKNKMNPQDKISYEVTFNENNTPTSPWLGMASFIVPFNDLGKFGLSKETLQSDKKMTEVELEGLLSKLTGEIGRVLNRRQSETSIIEYEIGIREDEFFVGYTEYPQ